MKHTTWTAALATLCLATACGPADSEEPNFGAAEMEAVAVGDFSGTLANGNQPTSFNLHLEHAPPGTTPACFNRTLVSPACIDVSELALRGEITTGDGLYAQSPVQGSFAVFGLEMSGGELLLSLPQGARLRASYRNGTFQDCQLQRPDSAPSSCTIAK